MAGPRIIFTRFSNADSPKLVPWREHRRRVIGSQGERVRRAADGPRLAVVCSRWYVAERERRHSLQLTLESLPIATIASGARQYVDRPATIIRQLV